MFNSRHFKLVKELRNIRPQLGWINFSNKQNRRKDSFLESVISDNKFVEDDINLRAMVEDMIKREFPERLKNEKEYDFLVESVMYKLKKKQLDSTTPKIIEQ